MLLFLQIHSSFSVSRFSFFRETEGIFFPSFRPHWKKIPPRLLLRFPQFICIFFQQRQHWIEFRRRKKNALAATAKKKRLELGSLSVLFMNGEIFASFPSPPHPPLGMTPSEVISTIYYGKRKGGVALREKWRKMLLTRKRVEKQQFR